ncbi:hypothetical protein [Pseudonocardia humida]|nr:hypothetical protein [Pseudonocardia humida]
MAGMAVDAVPAVLGFGSYPASTRRCATAGALAVLPVTSVR